MRALLDERGVSAYVRGCAVRLDVENVIGHVFEERAVVADEHHRLVRRLEILLEPARGLEIQMVRRLIEKKHICRRDELARETDASALAAAQPLERARARIHGIEPEAVEHGIHAWRDRVAALALEPLQVVRVSREHLLAHRLAELSHLRRLIGQRLLQREKLGKLPRRGLPNRLRIAEVAVLLEKRDPKAGLTRDHASRRLHLAGDQLEERRLSRAVAADDSPSLACGNREGDIGEEFRRAELHGDVGQRELRHVVAIQPLHSASASPTLNRFCWRTSGIFSINGSSTNSSSHRSSDIRAFRSPRSRKRFELSSMSADTPSFCAKRRSSPSDAERSVRSTKCVFTRRSAKNRSAFLVSGFFLTPKT